MDYKYKIKKSFLINDKEYIVDFERKGSFVWAGTTIGRKRISVYAYNRENAFSNLRQAVHMILNVKKRHNTVSHGKKPT